MAKRKVKYNPKGQYVCVRGTISHPVAGYVQPSDEVVFDMAHRTSDEIEFLVEVKGVIAPVAETKAQSEVKVNDSNS